MFKIMELARMMVGTTKVTLTLSSRYLPSVGEDAVELRARLDAELGEHLAQVVLNRARADEHAGGDLGVGQAVARHPRDQCLLCGELLIAGRDAALAGRLAGGPQLTPCPLGESIHTHRIQHLVGDAKLCARVDPATLPAEPFAVQQVRASEVCAYLSTTEPLD